MLSDSEVLVFTSSFCGYCTAAKRLLAKEGVPFREVDLDGDPEARANLVKASGGKRTVPQIFVGKVHVGGYDDLARLHRRGGLDPLLEEQGVRRGS